MNFLKNVLNRAIYRYSFPGHPPEAVVNHILPSGDSRHFFTVGSVDNTIKVGRSIGFPLNAVHMRW